MANVDTSGCCGGDGKHLNGCNRLTRAVSSREDRRRGKAEKDRAEKDSKFKEAQARQKEQAKLNNVGKKRATAFMDAEIPQGHRQTKTADGYYVIVKK